MKHNLDNKGRVNEPAEQAKVDDSVRVLLENVSNESTERVVQEVKKVKEEQLERYQAA